MQTSKFNTPSRTRKCILFLLMARSLYCNQGVTTNPYRSQQTKPTFHDFFNLNCKSEHDIHLTEFILCNIQYVGKAEVAFNLRLNNHRKDSKGADPNLACNHNFKDIISTKLVKFNHHRHTAISARLQKGTASGQRKFLGSENYSASSIWI